MGLLLVTDCAADAVQLALLTTLSVEDQNLEMWNSSVIFCDTPKKMHHLLPEVFRAR